MTLVQPTRILVVGGGGREHALAWKLAAEPGVNEVVAAPGSDGIAEEPRVRLVPLDEVDPAAVVALARARSVELVVVGPEAWLAAGVADELEAAGIPVFGPGRAAARIETSKAFCREVAQSAGVPMPRAIVAATAREAAAAVRQIGAAGRGFVVKEDGLAAGKGVTVHGPEADVEGTAEALEATAGDRWPLLVEERLEGREASLIALCDGRDAVALPLARDHKRLLDGDEGPNTGGMGAYSPLPDLPDETVEALLDRFHRPVLAELARRGTPFRGALYAGLMLTADGPRLLEFNARFGDPETQALLPRVAVALGPLLLAAAQGRLRAATGRLGLTASRLPAVPGASVAIVLAGGAYPSGTDVGTPIEGIAAARADGALVFHAGTRRGASGGWETNGGRILTVVGRGAGLDAARAAAESAAERIAWPGLHRRRDVAAHRPLGERVA